MAEYGNFGAGGGSNGNGNNPMDVEGWAGMNNTVSSPSYMPFPDTPDATGKGGSSGSEASLLGTQWRDARAEQLNYNNPFDVNSSLQTYTNPAETGEFFKDDPKNIYDFGLYTGKPVADPSDATRQAWQSQMERALNGSQVKDYGANNLLYTLAGDGMTSPVDTFANSLVNNAGDVPGFIQQHDVGSADFLSPYKGSLYDNWDPRSGQATAGQADAVMADINEWRGGENGYLDAMVDRAQKRTLANTAAAFSKNGRYGSGSHEAAAHDAAGNVATQMYGQAYEGDQNRSLQARNAFNTASVQNAALGNQAAITNAQLQTQAELANASQLNDWYSGAANRALQAWATDQSNRLNAYDSYEKNRLGAYNTYEGNKLSGWGTNMQGALQGAGLLQQNWENERNRQMGASQMALDYQNADYNDIDRMRQVGQEMDDYNQSIINAKRDFANELGMYDYNTLMRRLAADQAAYNYQG